MYGNGFSNLLGPVLLIILAIIVICILISCIKIVPQARPLWWNVWEATREPGE